MSGWDIAFYVLLGANAGFTLARLLFHLAQVRR